MNRLRRAAAALGLAGFVALATVVHHAGPLAWDLPITRAFQRLHGPWIDGPLGVLSAIGFPPVVGIVYGAILLGIYLRGARREACIAAFATLGAAGIHRLVADLVARARPSPDLIAVAHPLPVRSSFPSGHVQNATAFLGFLAYLLITRLPPSRGRSLLVALLVFTIAGMAAARIYFGEHWPSDVLGGLVLGGVWLCVVIEIDHAWGRRRARLHGAPSSRDARRSTGVESRVATPEHLTRRSHRGRLSTR
jgi:membrane-associated phospholipid phosphatase